VIDAHHFLTSPAAVTAKYCNEHVCVCVCVLSVRPSAFLPNHTCDLYQILVHIADTAVGSCSSGVTKSRGEGAILGVLPHWQCIVQHTKTAEPIEMPFGLITWVGPRYVLDGGPDPQGKGQFLGDIAHHCKVMGNSMASCAKTAKPINMPYWTKTIYMVHARKIQSVYRKVPAKNIVLCLINDAEITVQFKH